MTIIDFPDGIFPQAGSGGGCEPVATVQLFSSGRTGAQQAVLRGAGEVWIQEVTLITFGTKERELAKALAQLRGPLNKLRCPDLYAYSRQVDGAGNAVYSGSDVLFTDNTRFTDGTGWARGSAATVTLDGAISVGDTTITIQSTSNDPYLLQANDRIQIGDVLYAVLDYDYTTLDVIIHPPVRAAAADNATVTTHKPRGLWRLPDASQIIPSDTVNLPSGPVRTRQLRLIEAL